jgi:hypothetical protein
MGFSARLKSCPYTVRGWFGEDGALRAASQGFFPHQEDLRLKI